uniref:NADH dehydrogenase subunit 6 n=1 Tax=Colossendeis brevirostris TaxID=619823 RepID=A0A9E7V4H2_9CHEL|nr:NADH dehydrogenase subunit 6 [Colossendeis brevirostris]UYX57812.1 NADH dehydrogenase subunit 6 [Colossendeis brevirostris]
MKILLFSLMLMVMLTLLISHPLLMVILILSITFNINMIISLILNLSWNSYILIIIFLGGMLVLFIYIASISSNEKFKKLNIRVLTPLLILPLYMFIETPTLFSANNNFMASISSMYMASMMHFTLLIMFYLIITLLISVKIADNKFGPIRQK